MKRFKPLVWRDKLHELCAFEHSSSFYLKPLNVTGNIYVRTDVEATEEEDLKRPAKSRLRFAAR
jgi:hypothetical protein